MKPRFQPALALSVLLVLAFTPSPASADITAEYALDSVGSSFAAFGSETGIQGRGQVFEASVEGELTAISLRAGRVQDHDVDLVVSLYAESSGIPVGEALVQQTIPASQIPVGGAGGIVKADFTGSEVELALGTRYVITALPAVLEPDNNPYFLNGSLAQDASYSDGAACFIESGSWGAEDRDWAFRVEVRESTPVEAATWGSVKREYVTGS